MRRLACRIVTIEQRLRLKHIHTIPGLAARAPPRYTCSGTDWTLIKRCCCSSSGAQKQEQLVSGMPVVDLNSVRIAKRKCEVSDDMPGVRFEATHVVNCALDGVVSNPGIPDGKIDGVHITNGGDGAECRSIALDDAVDKPGITAICRDELVDCVQNDFSNSGTIIDPAYMPDCWDKALEEAIVNASDALMCGKGFDNACMTSHKVEDAMARPGVKSEALNDAQADSAPNDDLRCISTPSTEIEVEDVAKCDHEVLYSARANAPHEGEDTDGPMPNPFNDIQASEVASNFNAYQQPSDLEDCFSTTPYSTMDISWKEEEHAVSGDEWPMHQNDVPLKFSQQQMAVLEAIACGRSVFITGSAGTGKSFLLLYIIRMLRKAVGQSSVFVTASTGLAACALNGTTLHSFAGIGLGSGSPECLAVKVLRNKDSRRRWTVVQVLIIDEVSMIDGELFDKLDYVARRVRENGSCFGGIQLIVTGDFFQLPPVNPPNRRKFFAFQADCWNECFDLQVELEHVFRQSDSIFVKMLNEIRKGAQTSETLQNLSMCQRVLPDDGTGIAPTRLYPLKVDVKHENMQELRALEATIITFNSVDSAPDPLHRYMLDSMRAEKVLQLCVGAQVMLTKNIDTSGRLVNGAKGVVIGFQSRYNAFTENELDEESKLLKHMGQFVSPRNLWPVVRFDCGVRTLGPKKEFAEDGGVEVASRIQVPLILAWALSVHKCQGMTLSKVQTDLSKAFEYGMVYVALSRVKDLDGLQLVGFDPTRIKVHPDVVTFFDKLTEGCSIG